MKDVQDSLMERLTRGELDAVGDVYRTFEPVLRVMVRRRLTPRLRAKFDSTDVVQSAWADVLKGFRDEGWQLSNRQHLRAYLAKVTYNHLFNYCRKHNLAFQYEQPLVGDEQPGLRPSASRARASSHKPMSSGSCLWTSARQLIVIFSISSAGASRSPKLLPEPVSTRAACVASSTTWRGNWPLSAARCQARLSLNQTFPYMISDLYKQASDASGFPALGSAESHHGLDVAPAPQLPCTTPGGRAKGHDGSDGTSPPPIYVTALSSGTASLASKLVEEMVAAWQRGDRPAAEAFLVRHPELGAESALRLIHEECVSVTKRVWMSSRPSSLIGFRSGGQSWNSSLTASD